MVWSKGFSIRLRLILLGFSVFTMVTYFSQRTLFISSFIPPQPQTNQQTILITKWSGSLDFFQLQQVNEVCSNKCFFTTNPSAWSDSSAVVFHGNNYDYLNKKLTRPSPNQIWIWLNFEPAPYYQPKSLKNKHLQFNWTLSYRRDSDIVVPYSRIYPRNQIPPQMKKIVDTEGFPEFRSLPSLSGFRERKMAAWIVSHCPTWSKRESLVAEMQKTIPVDIYGSCGPLKCQNSRKKLKRIGECRWEIHKEYKFYLAFENALCTDYVTEKFFDTLELEMVPIVYGSAEYSKNFPPNSFINVLDYKNISQLAIRLNYLSENPEEWLKYFDWKKSYQILHSKFLPAYCDICDKLIDQNERYPNGIPQKYYEDISHWWLFNQTTGKPICKTDNETEQIISFL